MNEWMNDQNTKEEKNERYQPINYWPTENPTDKEPASRPPSHTTNKTIYLV
jgi:hypothetical protein